MQIKASARESVFVKISKYIDRTRAITFLGILLYTMAILAGGYQLRRSGISFGHAARSLKNELIQTQNKVNIFLSNSEPEHINIEIDHENYMRLLYEREIAVNRGILISDNNDYVRAVISNGDKTTPVELRLKGDWIDHLQGEKWSFRIRVRGDNTLFGMKQFSIQHPRVRNYIYEWIFHRALKEEGVLGLRYDFITVSLNGKDLGIYALEEHFEKRLIADNELREGPIIRFDESSLWSRKTQVLPLGVEDIDEYPFYLASDIDAFQTSDMVSDPVKFSQFLTAQQLLDQYRRGELSRSDVFDIQKLARFYAVSDLMGAHHGLNWVNLRFYYNPITSRLEPIGFDGDSGEPIRTLGGISNKYGDASRVFEDLPFLEAYISALENLSQPAYLDALLTNLNVELRHEAELLGSEFSEFSFSPDVFYRNQQFIRGMLSPTKGLSAYYRQASDDWVELELGTVQELPVEILNITYKNELIFAPDQRTILLGRQSSELVNYSTVRFNTLDKIKRLTTFENDLIVTYRILGTSRIREEPVFPWSIQSSNVVDQDIIRQKTNINDFDFAIINEASKQIQIKQGAWDIDQSLIIPEGYLVVGREGTVLNLVESALVLSYSPLELIGSEDSPFVIQSSDSSGQGIIVINAVEESTLEHVAFRDLMSPNKDGWSQTGAATFYNSPVYLSHSEFINIKAEDAVNLVRTRFGIDNCVFVEMDSDAIDSDYSEGFITNSFFANVGNDAIDVSGSVVDIFEVSINGAGDKGLSVGENSTVSVDYIDIKGAEIAIASKDLSYLWGSHIEISNSNVGLASYQKKPEFGPATLEAYRLGLNQVSMPFLVEFESTLSVENQAVQDFSANVYEILYGTE